MNPSTRLKRTGFSMLLPSKEPRPLVPSTGATRKSPKPSTSAKTSVPAISFLESSCSSPKATLVERVNAFMPSQRVSPRERAPLMMGRRKSLLRRVMERNRSARRSTSPEGARTAIPQKFGERIKTPSMMACPPTLIVFLLPVLAGLAAILEALHPTAGVHYTLLASVERVALGAEVDRDRISRRRARLEFVAAHATYQRLRVLRMYTSLHSVPPAIDDTRLFYRSYLGKRGSRVCFFPTPWSALRPLSADALELAEELGVRAGLLELLDQELYLLAGVEGVEDATDLPDPLGLGRLHEQLLLTRGGVLDVDGRVD